MIKQRKYFNALEFIKVNVDLSKLWVSSLLKEAYRKESFFLLLILLFGFALRLMFNPGLGFNDEYEYASSAYKIFINGDQPTNQGALRMAFIVPIGIIIKLIGFKASAFTSFMFAISMLNLFLVFKVCRSVFNSTVSLTAAFFMALLPIEIKTSTSLLPDSINQLFFLLALLLFISFQRNKNIESRRNNFKLIGSGLLVGLSYSTKEIGVFLLFPLIGYLLITKEKLKYSLFLILGFVLVICIEFLYSYVIWGDCFARYSNQFSIVNHIGNYYSEKSNSDYIKRFFVSYPFQLFFPFQKSGNQFGIYYLITLIILIAQFRKYVYKMNDLTLFLLCVFSFLFLINFSIIKINPLTPLIRPNPRYLIPINGLICIILAKLLNDLFSIHKYVYKISIYSIAFLSIIYLFISINASSLTAFNNPYYYSTELAKYTIKNKLVDKYDNIYCTFDVRNYLNIFTLYKYQKKIKDLDQIEVKKLTGNDVIIVNSTIMEGVINDSMFGKDFPEKIELLKTIPTESTSSFNVFYSLPKPKNIISKTVKSIENLLSIHYFTYCSESQAVILVKK